MKTINRTHELEDFFNSLNGVQTTRNIHYPSIGCIWVHFSKHDYPDLTLEYERMIDSSITESYTLKCIINVLCISDSVVPKTEKTIEMFKRHCLPPKGGN